jgi:Divergent InlB B-repeat domain
MTPPNAPRIARRPLTASLLVAALAMLVVTALPASAVESVEPLGETLDATDLALALAGDGVDVTSATHSGDDLAAGTFSGGAESVGLGSGIVLSSGDITNVLGQNDAPNTTTAFGTPGDPDLDELSDGTTFDASVLQFSFTPETSAVEFQYVFSSEEYLEYVGGGFNDAFGFYVNGTNCAVVDGSIPVTVDSINNTSNAGLFIDNATDIVDTEMDGLTVVLTCSASVTPDVENTMKLVIADTNDANFDSAVFLGQGTFAAVQPLDVATAGEGGGTVTSDPAGINCGDDCTEGYEEGTDVTLTATPDDGSTFAGWSGDCEGAGACVVSMGGPRSVTATFDVEDTSSCPEGSDCDEGTVPPGGLLSTVTGPGGNPVNPADPFAIGLRNVTTGTLTGTIVEEDCDGTQEGDPLCSVPRVGGVLGNFQFSTGSDELTTTTTRPKPVAIARLFYDRTLFNPWAPVKMYYQKAPGHPVLKLPVCRPGVRTECFTVKKLKSGDQIVKVPLSADPRVTRG